MGEMTWVEEGGNGHASTSRKRRTRPKRFEFVGWGSKQLIEFLQSVGKDTREKVSRFEVSDIIGKYIAEKGLLEESSKKKKFVCDDNLLSLFGSKKILRIKVYDLLEKHYQENQDDSDYDLLYDDEEGGPVVVANEERRVNKSRKVVEKKRARGVFAAVTSDNIKLVYLRKSLVKELVKCSESFESKMLGSYVRIKSDPNDYLQKHPYQIVQVTGVKKEDGTDDFLLQVTNYMKDVSVSMLSDDNFSQEECEDLHQRVTSGFLKKPTIVEMEEKVRSLHEDQTKHWLGREIARLQILINRTTEKGFRRELTDYLDKRELLQKPEEQSRLFREVPEVMEEKLVPDPELTPEAYESDEMSESPISSIQQTPEIRNICGREDQQCNGFLIPNPSPTPSTTLYGMEPNMGLAIPTASAGDEYLHVDAETRASVIIGGDTPTEECDVSQPQSTIPVTNLSNGSRAQPNPSEVIELSDDDDDENDNGVTLDPKAEDDEVISYGKEKLTWFYKDPDGGIQGPFSLTQLKLWYDAEYFPEDFKVWMTGKSSESAVLLASILRRV